MKAASLSIFLPLVFFIGSGFAHADFGTLKEVVAAAKKGQEPAYIKPLLEQLSKELHQFAESNIIRSTEKKVAWLHTMQGFFGGAISATSRLAGDAARIATGKNQHDFVSKAFMDSWLATSAIGSDLPAVIQAVKPFADAAYDAHYDTTCEVASGASQRHVRLVTLRVAEWRIWNYFLQNIQKILESIYPEVLEALSDDPAGRHLKNDKRLVAFVKRHFGNLTPEAMLFLAPWLAQIVTSDQVPQAHQPLFESMSSYAFDLANSNNAEDIFRPLNFAFEYFDK